ncbi:J domain-containing protein [Sorangium sp. So ce327]|uniref:J domain-containing protein n=1 Tax=Sorangium sp. So ce327 TaxID=3133301 RepID=UPI003F63E7BB
MNNNYQILGVAENATADEIRSAYRAKAKEHHPDLHGGDPAAGDRFKRINAAHDVLSDPTKRAQYDASLRAARMREAVEKLRVALARTPVTPAFRQPAPAPPTPPRTSTSAGDVLFGLGLLSLATWGVGALAKGRSRYDPSVDRYRGPDGRFRSG